MDSTSKASYAADTSFLGSSPQSENVQDFDTSSDATRIPDPRVPAPVSPGNFRAGDFVVSPRGARFRKSETDNPGREEFHSLKF